MLLNLNQFEAIAFYTEILAQSATYSQWVGR